MTGLCRQCNVREIDGLIAIVSVIRPGAANEGKKRSFTRRYQGLEPVTYPHPSLEPCLRSTFGLVVYEEHILQLCEAFAGLPPGRADVLRRALEQTESAVIEEIRGEFFARGPGARPSPEKIAEVWELGRRLCRLRLLQSAQHRLRRGGVSEPPGSSAISRPSSWPAVLTNGKGLLPSAGLCAGMPPARHPDFLPPSRQPARPGSSWRGRESIRVPLTRVKGLTQRTVDRMPRGAPARSPLPRWPISTAASRPSRRRWNP